MECRDFFMLSHEEALSNRICQIMIQRFISHKEPSNALSPSLYNSSNKFPKFKSPLRVDDPILTT